jgi:hypothetical protein
LNVGEDGKGIANVFQYQADVEADAMNQDPAAGFPKWEGLDETKTPPVSRRGVSVSPC